MKTWDAVIIGGGIIGVSLALELRHHGANVLVVERSIPGREASYAAAGMLADCDPATPAQLRDLAVASARLYPEFVHQLEDESGLHVDLRSDGTILFTHTAGAASGVIPMTPEETAQLEPELSYAAPAVFLSERSVDPRALMSAALKAAKHRGIEVASGAPARELLIESGRVAGVRAGKTHFNAPVVVNCAGAWAGQIAPQPIPTRPIKGQMLALVARRGLLRHVVRAPEFYLVPRSDGRILVGSTEEEAGFDKHLSADTIHRFHQAAASLVAELGQAKILEAWAGLRPGTPDGLPILGRGAIDGYFVACGHFRNGILLAPVTALVMTQIVRGQTPSLDISAFAPQRF